MKVTIFGAGNVGRGFLGLELYRRGYEITFVDVNPQVVGDLNRRKGYVVSYSGDEGKDEVHIRQAIHTSQPRQIVAEVEGSDLILTAVGTSNLESVSQLIADGIRNAQGKVVIACENAPRNTDLLKTFVSKYLTSPQDHAEFPNCVIDRICLSQKGPIVVEKDFEWIIETKNPHPIGVEKTTNLDPLFSRKLFLVNGAHAIIGYAGVKKGMRFVHECMGDKEISMVVNGALQEASFGLAKEYQFDTDSLTSYVERVDQRFRNPEINDEVIRLVRDPIRKLQRHERLIGPAILSYKHGKFPEYLCHGIANLLEYCGDQQGKKFQDSLSACGLEKTLSTYTQLESDHPIICRIADLHRNYRCTTIREGT